MPKRQKLPGANWKPRVGFVIFSGKKYYLTGAYERKSQSNEMKKSMIARGFKVRTKKRQGMYEVYIRNEKFENFR